MRKVYCLVLVLLMVLESASQTVDSTQRKVDFIEIGLFAHSISLPLEASNHLIGLNRTPGIVISAGKSIWKKREKFNTKYLLSFSAYHQKELHYGFELNNALLAQYHLLSNVNIEGAFGVGYLHTFEDAALYRVKDGNYKQVRDWGRPQFTTSALIGTSFALSEKVSVVANYKFLLQLPFATKGGILFTPHSRVSLGTRVNLQKR